VGLLVACISLIGYMLLAAIVAGVTLRVNPKWIAKHDFYSGEIFAFAFLWPVFATFGIAYCVMLPFVWIAKKISGKEIE